MRKLDNPFTTSPEPDVKFWTAKSKPMLDFKRFFEVECMTRGAWSSHAVVGDVGSGKTRLFKYFTGKFEFDPSKVVCYVSLNEVFKELTAEYRKEIDVRFLEIFHNEIYKQLEKIYEDILRSSEGASRQRSLAKKIIDILRESKKKVIGPRLKHLGILERMITGKKKAIKKASTKKEKQQLQEEMEALETAISGKLREEIFTSEEFYSFLEIFLKRLRKELDIDIFVIYVDELERIVEMERDYKVFLKSTVESELRDRLIERFSGLGLKIIVACTSQIWRNFEPRFREAFRPQPIPNLEEEDLEEAIKDHLERINQRKFNPFKDKYATKFIAYYSYHNFRNCMYVLNFCYEEYIRQLKDGISGWICDLNYVMKNHFDKSIRIEFYNHCIQILERQFPRLKRKQTERWMRYILVRFEEFSYDEMWKAFKFEVKNKSEFDTFVSTLRNIRAISEIRENIYIVNRDNFATIELRRTPTEEKILGVFFELSGRTGRTDRAKLLRKLEQEGLDDRTIDAALRSLGDTLQVAGNEIVHIGSLPGIIDNIRGIVRSIRREHYKKKVDMETEKLAPYILSKVWSWEFSKYADRNDMWLVSTSFDPSTGGAIERTVFGVVFFRDYRYEKPSSEDMLKIDILNLKKELEKNSRLEFAVILCIYGDVLPDFLGLAATKAEISRAKSDPLLWKRLFGIEPHVLGTENRVTKQGFDIIWKEEQIKFSDMIFVYPIHPDELFPEGSKLENQLIIDYILARDQILNIIGKESDVEDKYLDPLLITIKGKLLNPILDTLLKRVLNSIWEIDLPIGMLRDKSLWPQSLSRKKKWVDNEITQKILIQIATSGTIKANEENKEILSGLTSSGFFGYLGKKVEEIYLRGDTVFSSKPIPQQFKSIFDSLTDELRDANAVFMAFLEQHEPFMAGVPGEKLLSFNPNQLWKNNRARSLVESVDVALYIMSRMFPESIAQTRRDDGRFVYHLLKEIIDPQKFLEDIGKLNKAIVFLTEKGFELKEETEEFGDLLRIGKAIKHKLDKSLDIDARQIMLEEKESRLTGKKDTVQARCDYLYSKINEKFTNIKDAFLAFPVIKEWMKKPYLERWNEQTQSTEEEVLLPLPDSIKTFLTTSINAWIKTEEYTKKEAKKIRDIWETDIWSKIYDKIADEANPIIKLVETVNKGMKDVPNVSTISKHFEEKASLTFDEYAKLLKRIKNLEQIVTTLRITNGYIKSYNEKLIDYNSAIVSTCNNLMKMVRAKFGNLTYIVSELIKIDACQKRGKELQIIIRKARQKFGDKYNRLILEFEEGFVNESEVRERVNDLLNDLILNGLYGCLFLYLLESDVQEEMIRILHESLENTKYEQFKENLKSIKNFCDRRKVKFREKDFWKKKRNRCLKKYESYVTSYMEGIWRRQTTIPIEGKAVQNITQFEQLIDSFNEGIRRNIVERIPEIMGEPYSTILSEVKNVYVKGKREIFATILKLLSSKKVRQYKIKPEEMLKYLDEVEKFGLLW